MLARKVLNETKDALELTNRTVIEVNDGRYVGILSDDIGGQNGGF
jgi:hypothetical protein